MRQAQKGNNKGKRCTFSNATNDAAAHQDVLHLERLVPEVELAVEDGKRLVPALGVNQLVPRRSGE